MVSEITVHGDEFLNITTPTIEWQQGYGTQGFNNGFDIAVGRTWIDYYAYGGSRDNVQLLGQTWDFNIDYYYGVFVIQLHEMFHSFAIQHLDEVYGYPDTGYIMNTPANEMSNLFPYTTYYYMEAHSYKTLYDGC